jgi:toxin FitB
VKVLLDTNVVSELRKGPRCNQQVAEWFVAIAAEDIYLSVLTIGELRKGVELIRRRDARGAEGLDAWLQKLVLGHAARILILDRPIAEQWGRLNVPDPLPVVDALIAATALVHGMTLASRNAKDMARTGVRWLNPFTGERGESG